jgi:Prokaryotic Cytochrome C oxidase subunit IV
MTSTTSSEDTSPAQDHAEGDRAITIAWIVLSAITIGSWWLSPAHSAATAVASVPISVAVIVLGFIKSRLIIRYFMEVRTAPRWLRLATDGWLVVLWGSVLVIYLY